ncbi:MAG: hypothetical protein AB7K24_33200 [Gemmataceae bacterium]
MTTRFVRLALLCLAFTVAARAAGPATTGKLRLECESPWHKLDLSLSPGPLFLEREGWEVFNLPQGAEPGQSWKVDVKQALPVLQAIHAVVWKSSKEDEAAYKTWPGKGAALQTLGVQTGTLDISFHKDADGQRLDFSGTLKAFDAGRYAARLGPAWWKEEWTHRIEGKLHLDASRVPTALEFTDQIETTGLFFNQGKNKKKESEPFTRKGELKVRLDFPRALNAEQEKQVRQWIAQLGSESFDEREAATRKLEEFGPKIAPLLRGVGLSSPDAEVVRRSKAILARLEESR